MSAGLSGGVMITSLFVTKSARSVTPGSSLDRVHPRAARGREHVGRALGLDLTGEVVGRREVEGHRRAGVRGFEVGTDRVLKAAVSEDAANTVSSVLSAGWLADADGSSSADEQAPSTSESEHRAIRSRFNGSYLPWLRRVA